MRLSSVRQGLYRWARSLNSTIAENPGKTAVVLTGVKAGSADAVVQWTEGRCNGTLPWDWRRTALFTAFGAGYQGGAQYLIFNRVLDGLWPGITAGMAVRKVVAVNFVCDPLFFFPAFYTLKELADPRIEILPTLANPAAVISKALSKYREHYFQDWKNSWSFWLPGHAISFGVMPAHLRFPWMATVSFGYCCMLSCTRGHISEEVVLTGPGEEAALDLQREEERKELVKLLQRKELVKLLRVHGVSRSNLDDHLDYHDL